MLAKIVSARISTHDGWDTTRKRAWVVFTCIYLFICLAMPLHDWNVYSFVIKFTLRLGVVLFIVPHLGRLTRWFSHHGTSCCVLFIVRLLRPFSLTHWCNLEALACKHLTRERASEFNLHTANPLALVNSLYFNEFLQRVYGLHISWVVEKNARTYREIWGFLCVPLCVHLDPLSMPRAGVSHAAISRSLMEMYITGSIAQTSG